ncbi:molybdenum cofactor guanylyltransferase [Methanobrevibacter sp. TMH8]|uniref:molybdenum cofactor guanylyltransferase n=1 Tax=Methanobrevibacter sp. TMH8 TaxID=2848611 RepID=UPI001CCE0D92|nr:molybdenum cofactor guanylyltransferase [Methanobrevibacter sp. TMH8]MBZ9571031.1 molybdenum cofactor guanylyltransferase [Methanobrevibacter sp. TMH8]
MKNKNIRSAIILCGGMSRRMGEDKGSMKIDEKPMIIYLLEALNSKIDEVILVLNDETRIAKYKSLITDYINNQDTQNNHNNNNNNNNNNFFDFNIKLVEDEIKNKGPLSGIMTGLKTISSNYALVLPCDSPYVSSKFIDYMFITLNEFISSKIDVEGIVPYHKFNYNSNNSNNTKNNSKNNSKNNFNDNFNDKNKNNNKNNKKELLNNSEPLHSIYKKENYFVIKNLLKSDKKEVKSFINIINSYFIPIDDNSNKSSKINEINFKNINYKNDL